MTTCGREAMIDIMVEIIAYSCGFNVDILRFRGTSDSNSYYGSSKHFDIQ